MSVVTQLPTFYISTPHACSYFSDREASTVFVDPQNPADSVTYNYLIRAGFRRSGDLVYRPQCYDCNDCVSVRLPVDSFRPRRNQKRIAAKNSDLDVRIFPGEFHNEHFDLYKKYQEGRHPESSMNDDNPEHYDEFLFYDSIETELVEFRLEGQLLCVAVIDIVADGLSAVYTFYDPDHAKRGLGVNAILWQVEEARRRGKDFVYLGYWISGNDKMQYKTDYSPIEGFIDKKWRLIDCKQHTDPA